MKMLKTIFNCYPGESDKLLEYLNRQKEAGYVVTKIEFYEGLVKAEFQESTQEFEYSIDYSDLYTSNIAYFDERNEYFDIAKLNSWKLQCFTGGIGIWINHDCKNAIPFLTETEYQEIKEKEADKRIRAIKITAISNFIIFILALLRFIYSGWNDIFYGLPFGVFYGYVVYQVLKKKRDYPKLVIGLLSITYLGSQYLLSELTLIFGLLIEFIFIICCLDLLRKDSYILKKEYLMIGMIYFWIILFIYHIIFG